MKRARQGKNQFWNWAWCELAMRRIIEGLLVFLAMELPNAFQAIWCAAIDWVIESWTRLADHAAVSVYTIAEASRLVAVAAIWTLLAFFPFVLASTGSFALLWPAVAWSLVVVTGSTSAYLRWRAFEDRARDEWRDVVVGGRTIQEWLAVISGEDVIPPERIAAISSLIKSGTPGQKALMAALACHDASNRSVSTKLWILAVVADHGSEAARFDLTIRNLIRTTSNERLRLAAVSALERVNAKGQPTQLLS
jgi:hypothetical protein